MCWGYEKEQKHLSHVRVSRSVLNAYIMTKYGLAFRECLIVLCTSLVLVHLDSAITL